MKFSIKDFLSKCDQILNCLQCYQHLKNCSLTFSHILAESVGYPEVSCEKCCSQNFRIKLTEKYI